MAAEIGCVLVCSTKNDLNEKICDVELTEKVKFVRQTSTKDFGNNGEDHCALGRVPLERTLSCNHRK